VSGEGINCSDIGPGNASGEGFFDFFPSRMFARDLLASAFSGCEKSGFLP
jgi:hypothetical protein